jgi:hypothetical protein
LKTAMAESLYLYLLDRPPVAAAGQAVGSGRLQVRGAWSWAVVGQRW